MTTQINPTCPHCKKQLTIKLNIVDKLQARIKYLEKELGSNNAAQTLKNIFGEFKK
jgi:transcription initiation factor IIE alpha subunit